MLIGFWSPKGGSGVSVFTAGCACFAARDGAVLLVDTAGDLPAALGIAEPELGVADLLAVDELNVELVERVAIDVGPSLRLLAVGGAAADLGAVAGSGARLAQALSASGESVFIDLGRASVPEIDAMARTLDALVLVIRPCYLASKRALNHPLLNVSGGFVLIDDANHSLTGADLERVLGLPLLVKVPPRPAVARAVDSGTLGWRVPDALSRPVRTLLATLGAVARDGFAA